MKSLWNKEFTDSYKAVYHYPRNVYLMVGDVHVQFFKYAGRAKIHVGQRPNLS